MLGELRWSQWQIQPHSLLVQQHTRMKYTVQQLLTNPCVRTLIIWKQTIACSTPFHSSHIPITSKHHWNLPQKYPFINHKPNKCKQAARSHLHTDNRWQWAQCVCKSPSSQPPSHQYPVIHNHPNHHNQSTLDSIRNMPTATNIRATCWPNYDHNAKFNPIQRLFNNTREWSAHCNNY